MVEEAAGYLIGRKTGVFLDLTCGGGGHLKYCSRLLSHEAYLIGIDQDFEAVLTARENLREAPQKVTIVNSKFSNFDGVLEEMNISRIDGALMDLGVSSYQIDTPDRGFSFTADGPLDMRMDREGQLTAADIINKYAYDDLKRLFKVYGEEPKAARAARAVVEARERGAIRTTGELAEVLAPLFPPNRRNSSLARLFQAIRIEVNGELRELEETLPKVADALNPGGRMVVISYHSLEDRTVKRFFAGKSKGLTGPADLPAEISGTPPELKVLTRKVLVPTEHEIKDNSRARSAKLRAAEKI